MMARGVASDARFDDVLGGDAIAFEQLVGLTAAWNLAHCEPMHGEAG